MKLKPETVEAHAKRIAERQLELPHMPDPMTANRAKDFKTCKRCQRNCNFCDVTGGKS